MSSPAHLVEAYLAHWLREVNPESLKQLGFNGAMDALFDMLNAGLIKIEADADGFTDLVPCMVPQPPRKKLRTRGPLWRSSSEEWRRPSASGKRKSGASSPTFSSGPMRVNGFPFKVVAAGLSMISSS